MIKKVTHDFETRSECDLKKAGAYKYSLDPSTRPTCYAFKANDSDKIWFLDFYQVTKHWSQHNHRLKMQWQTWITEGYLFSSHNAFFERCIYENIMVKRYGWPSIPPRQTRCTAAKAAACALPRNLAGAGEALQLRVQKDFRGHQAVMATCKPTRQYNAWRKAKAEITAGKKVGIKKITLAQSAEPQKFISPRSHIEVFETLYRYCKIDVKSEEELDQTLPDLSPKEQEIWFLNQQINWRGLHIDIPTVQKVVAIMESESKIKLKQLDTLTMGLVTKPGAIKSILEFLEIEGEKLPNLRAKTVDDRLQDFDLDPDMRGLLELRKALSLSSTKKYQAFLNRATPDNRVRDILMYHGASTGRDTGTGPQFHNLPKGVIDFDFAFPYEPVENVASLDLEMLKLLYGPSLPMVFSSIIRNMLIPSRGCEIFAGDFSMIEVCALWWLADNGPGLEVLASGKDPYIYQASLNLLLSYEELEKFISNKEPWAIEARQLGKAQILGCGFGMGAPKFQTTAWDMFRLKLTLMQSKIAVQSYREENEAVPDMWEAYEDAAIKAIRNRGRTYITNKCAFVVESKFLWIELPSGRRLAYREPRISWRVREYEQVTEKLVNGKMVQKREKKFTEPLETIEFWAVNSKTKKWNLERTWGGTLTENIVQATARDIQMWALLRLEKAGYRALLQVHDEPICERTRFEGSVQEFTEIMCQLPPWAAGLPLKAKGWAGPRYKKA